MGNDIQGLDKLMRQLDSLGKLDVAKSSVVGMTIIKDRSVELAPEDTGFLKRSHSVVETEDGAELHIDAPYAIDVEMGTWKMTAQPFIRPAIDNTQDQVEQAIADDIEKKMKEVI